ncbi:MAG: Gfo/Idh/MocA family oxidoreductase [Planctomycetota bacterium]
MSDGLTPVRFGMIGGGSGAFIGAVHRTAMRLDGAAHLVAGALSSTPERAIASANELGIPRGYPDWRTMLDAESALPEADRIEAVSIVTPNDSHAAPAIVSLEAGFHVVLDKPMAASSDECRTIIAAAKRTGRSVTVTYNYTGYPLVRHARSMVRRGVLGTIRRIDARYVQGWLAGDLESTGQKQASWRTDPKRSGGAGTLGDIGTHAYQLAEFVTGRRPISLCASVRTHVPGRRVDDDASVLLRYDSGVSGTLTTSQICIGEENGLSLRVYGSDGALTWQQESPNELRVFTADGSRRTLTRGDVSLTSGAQIATRLPPGHPEGFHEAFANIYRGAADRVRGIESEHASLAPDHRDGAAGVSFVEACLRSQGAWVKVD